MTGGCQRTAHGPKLCCKSNGDFGKGQMPLCSDVFSLKVMKASPIWPGVYRNPARLIIWWWGGVTPVTETEMSSFWRNFHHWLHRKLSKWQLSVQSVIKISSKWQHFRFSECASIGVTPNEYYQYQLIDMYNHAAFQSHAWTRRCFQSLLSLV